MLKVNAASHRFMRTFILRKNAIGRLRIAVFRKPMKALWFIVVCRLFIREFKKTTTATSCRTSPNNTVNEQNSETARAKYNLVGVT